jgi:hypothetical protein
MQAFDGECGWKMTRLVRACQEEFAHATAAQLADKHKLPEWNAVTHRSNDIP